MKKQKYRETEINDERISGDSDFIRLDTLIEYEDDGKAIINKATRLGFIIYRPPRVEEEELEAKTKT